MGIKTKGNRAYVLRIVLLSVLSLLLGVGASFLSQYGMVLIPALAAILSVLFLLDGTRGRILSIAVSAVTVAVELALNLYLSFNCLASVLTALIIVVGLSRGAAKSTTAAIATALLALTFASYFLLAAFYDLGAFDLELAVDYLNKTMLETREELYEMLREITVTDRQGITVPYFQDEVIEATLDTYFAIIPAILTVLSFATVGIVMKIFSAIVIRFGGDKQLMTLGWTFGTSSLFAYFFIILSILQIFVFGTDAFAATVMNLYVVFLAVYAYVGYRFASFLFGRAIRKPRLAKFLIILSILFFAQFAIQLLAYAGVFETVMSARMRREDESDGTNS